MCYRNPIIVCFAEAVALTFIRKFKIKVIKNTNNTFLFFCSLFLISLKQHLYEIPFAQKIIQKHAFIVNYKCILYLYLENYGFMMNMFAFKFKI